MNDQARYKEFLPPLWVLGLIAAFGVFWLVRELKEILVLLVLGYSLAFVMEPAMQWLEKIKIGKHKLGRSAAFFVLLSAAILILVLLVVTAIPTISKEYARLSTQLPHYVEQAKSKVAPLIQQLEQVLPERFRPKSLMDEPGSLLDGPLAELVNFESVKKFVSAAGQAILGGYSFTLTILNLLLLPFIVYYLSIDFNSLHRQILLLVPEDLRLPTLKISRQIKKDVSAFINSQFIVCCVLFILYFLGLWGIGLELALLLAIISGFGNLIPYVGTLVGITLSSIMALVTFGDWSHLVQVWGLYGIVQFLEGTFITPSIMGKNVGLSPLVVLLALVIGGQLFGLLGLLLAIPMTAVLKVLLSEFHLWAVSREKNFEHESV